MIRKVIVLIIGGVIGLAGAAWGDYCPASGGCGGEYISDVIVGSINNTGTSCDGYADYTLLSTTMEIGTDYAITVVNGDVWFWEETCGIWVDWNQDEDFDDAGEEISVSGGPWTFVATITPPGDANLGETRMRVRIRNSGVPEACGDTSYGEVEDYTINVTARTQHCSASSQQCDPYINYFRLNSIDNGPSDCNAGGYSNFTGLETNLQSGNTYIAVITSGELGYDNEAGLWIDWNQDMDFDDPCETIQTNSGPYSSYAAFIVPGDAVAGSTRLRTRISYMTPPAACGEMSTGETEDYTVDIVSGEGEYCDAGGALFCGWYTYRFRIKAIDNSSGCSPYADYTSITTELEKDTAYPFIIDTGESGPATAVWIDWNDDKDFEDPCESIPIHYLVYNEPPYSNITLWTGTRYEKLNIPDWAGYGPKRLRIRTHYPSPCGYEISGEVEDYTIIIAENGSTVEEGYGGGHGTEEEPFLIYTAEQLNRIGVNNYQWESHFKLMADIDMNELGEDAYNIIGDEMFAFEGVFDGNCHTISNFTYQSDSRHRVGLFGRTAGNSLIKNVGLIAPEVHSLGCNAVGGLVGILESGTVSNCYVRGGSVSGEKAVGGLVGGNHGTVENCYSRSDVFGNDCVGGLVGYMVSGQIEDCYSASSVLGQVAFGYGGLIGCVTGGTTVNSFWDMEICVNSAGGTGKTTTEMQRESTFTDAGWDFVEVWDIGEDHTYPFLRRYAAGDLNHDGEVDFGDAAILCQQWLEERE